MVHLLPSKSQGLAASKPVPKRLHPHGNRIMIYGLLYFAPVAARYKGYMMKVAAFTKSFQDWPIEVVCNRFRQIGLDGLDLTVRKGGHIEPEDVEIKLPLAAKAAAEAGSEILFLTTDIMDPTPVAEKVVATAREIGIDRIKLGYYRCNNLGQLQEAMDEARSRIEAVAAMCKKYSVKPCIHIHSSTFMPSHGTMAYLLVKDISPDDVGVYADMLHMNLEGGLSGWREGLELIAPWLSLVSVKNYQWQEQGRGDDGQLRWKAVNVPVADGISPIGAFVSALKFFNYDGIYSMHSEYKGGGSYKDLSTEECLEVTKQDLEFFKKLF